MRILHVIHSMDPRSGGPSASLRHLAQIQAARGHAVSIITTDAQSAEPWAPRRVYRQQLENDPQLENVRLVVLEGYGRWKPFARFRYSPAARPTLESVFESDDHPDVVHIHGLFSHLTMTAARHARIWNIPYVMRPAGGLNPFCRRQGRALAKYALYRFWEKRNLDRSLFLHATSAREKEELRKLFRHKSIEVIPHGTTIPSLDSSSYYREVFLRKFPRLEGRRTVLFLSRLAPKKRVDLLIEAVANLRGDYPDLALAIAGSDAGYRRRAAALVNARKMNDSVFFLGFLTGALKEGAFAAAQFLALPSVDENFGLVVVEAMAHGLPVLVSDGVDSHVYVRDARAGVVVKPHLKSVERGMSSLLRRADRAGENGKRYAEQHLSWDRIAAQLEQLYARR